MSGEDRIATRIEVEHSKRRFHLRAACKAASQHLLCAGTCGSVHLHRVTIIYSWPLSGTDAFR